MIRFALAVIAVTMLAFPVHALERQEIINSVLKPCWMQAVKKNRVEGVTDDQMLELIMLMQASEVDKVVASVNTLLQHANTTEEQAAVLSMSRTVCINAINK